MKRFETNRVLNRLSRQSSDFQKYADLEGPECTERLDQRGLGEIFFENMSKNREKFHQINANSGLTETNGSVRQKAILVAIAMIEKGVTQEDIVVVCSKTHADQTVALLSILFVGAIVAPIDPDLNHHDCFALLQKLKPKMIFSDARACGQIERVLTEIGKINTCILVLFNIHPLDRLAFERYLTVKPDENFKVKKIKNGNNKVAFILPTQGTTGPAKLVCISHKAMLFHVCSYIKILENVERILSFFPLNWIVQAILICVSFHVPLTRILPGNFTERNACKVIRDMRVDHAILGTEYAIRIAHHVSLQDFDVSCLQCIVVGGYSTTALDMSQLRTSMRPINVIQVYGSTETGYISGFSEADIDAPTNPGSVGKLLPGVKIRIVDLDSRTVLGPNMWGELLVKSEGFMIGYYRDHGATTFAVEKGFYKTGDMAQYDKDGYIYIRCRICDLLEINGQRVSPLEIEDVILAHPFVQEGVVIGNCKEIVACIVKKEDSVLDEETLMSYVADRLPDYQCPTKIKFFDKFPKTAIGKVRKNDLRNSIFRISIKHSKSITNVFV